MDANGKAFNYTVIGNKTSINELSDAVLTFPAFSDRRVVVVKDNSLAKGSGEKIGMRFLNLFLITFA